MIKVDWRDVGVMLEVWPCISRFSAEFAYNLQILLANGKQELVADEMSLKKFC
jgi:hypothetical protein